MKADLFAPAVVSDPYPTYAKLQRETPVLHDAAAPLWLVSRYADAARVLSEPGLFSSVGAAVTDILMGMDGTEHLRVRRSAQPSVAASRVHVLEQTVRVFVRAAIQRAAGGSLEVMAAIADPLPLTVMADLLGVARERIHELRAAASAMLARDGAGVARGRDFVAARAARLEERFGTLAPDERIALGMLFNVAGTETAKHFIGNAVLLLARDPALQARLRADDERVAPFLEEVLRFETPVQRVWRVTTQPTRVGGVAIPAGGRVGVLLGAANRDADAFPDAQAFQAERAPNRHLAFGVGPHFCIGARLAKMQAAVTLSELLRSGPELRLATSGEAVDYLPTTAVRGPARLEIQISN